MNKLIIPRQLWFEKDGKIFHVDETALYEWGAPIVILGEAGMGKTELARRIGQTQSYSFCTARQLLRRGARPLLLNSTTLVIDALDEVGTKGEGEAVDLVLAKLNEVDFPRFVLTCRIADWRNATAFSALSEDYADRVPLVLHLEALTDSDVEAILADRLPESTEEALTHAREIMEHFHARKLDGLLGNPQTLELIARAATAGPLPDTKSALFAKATEILRREHRSEKIDLQLDEMTALDAAGAASAALLLTGAEAVVREIADSNEYELPLAEVAMLPGANALERVIGSRLFSGTTAERFTYWHRSIGEYLGAQWLATHLSGTIGRNRLLGLFHADALVPASLRGIHAWLAHQGDHELAVAVISKDPMGIIEYGDADSLDLEAARALLIALSELAQRDPHFREWKHYSIKSLMQTELLTQVGELVISPDVELGLRTLLLEAIPGSQLADALRIDLRRLILSHGEVFVHRSRAVDALITLGGEDWQSITAHLVHENTENSIRLALEIAAETQYAVISNETLIDLMIKRSQIETRSVRPFFHIAKTFPDHRLESFLDGIISALPRLGDKHDRPNNDELTDLGYSLIARQLQLEDVDPIRLWQWLRPFDEAVGFSRQAQSTVHDYIRANDIKRQAIQKFVLFEETSSKTLWQRAVRLRSRSPGLIPTENDVLLLLDHFEMEGYTDDQWKDLTYLVPHSKTEGHLIRERAKKIVANRPDMLSWIERLAEPREPEWKVKQGNEQRRREAKRVMRWRDQRVDFGAHIEEMRRGVFRWLFYPAQAYLGRLTDVGHDLPAQKRVSYWLGPELSQAAHTGFEAFLLSKNPPTAQEVADSYAVSMEWNAKYIIVAGAAERKRRLGSNFLLDLPDDRVLTLFFELGYMKIGDTAGIEGLEEAVEKEIRRRNLFEHASRQWIEPQLVIGREYVDQLYQLMRGDEQDTLSSSLAEEWLRRFPNLRSSSEVELIDCLLRVGRFDVLRTIEVVRRGQNLSVQSQANWNAVAFVVDFDGQGVRLQRFAASNSDWLWVLRDRLGGDRRQSGVVRLTNSQLTWIFSTFRSAYPPAGYPSGGWSGNTNPWDASDFLLAVVSRLANETSNDAVRDLALLRDASDDGYTAALRSRAVEQVRKIVQERYRPLLISELRAIADYKPPNNIADLQAMMLALLEKAQARIRSSPDDAWRGFYTDEGDPRDEERCRDHLLTILGLHPDGIDLLPEGHLADDKRADILALRPSMRLPLEVKGQWHDELWRAADSQLERLYARDYAAERRGIYLVLWFGLSVPDSKKPRARSIGHRRPQSQDDLSKGLIEASNAIQSGYVKVVVLDLSKSTS